MKKIYLFPDWWVNLYPITFYFIGAYIKEYQPKLSKIKNIAYIAITLLIHTTIHYLIFEKSLFNKLYLGQYFNILTLILAVLIFLLFYQKNVKSTEIKNILSIISICSLDMYLFSYIVDLEVYKYVKPLVETPKEHLLHMLPTALLVFILSFILAYLKKIIFDMIEKKLNAK